MQQHGGDRLADLLEQVRNEFATISQGRSSEHEHAIHNQIAELEHVRQKIQQLEYAHTSMKAKYENEITALRLELEQRGGPPNAAQQAPPSIGHGPANLFQGIMAGGGGLAPPQAPQDQPMQGQMAPPSSSFQPQGPPQHSFPPFQQPPPPPPAGSMNGGYGQQPQQQTASPGPGRAGYGPPATPHQRQPYPSSPHASRPTPPPNQLHHAQHSQITSYSQEEIERIGNSLSDYDPDKLPPYYKRSGDDWHAIFNPRANRRLDVDLVHTLLHESVVCCVRFSGDGRYVATGCNRSAQIFDVETGQQVCKLQDSNAQTEGDLYIRSVCFSPDGRFLATGAEDKLIRVSALDGLE